eukprot:589335-Amphidinium_carterae.1
MLTSYFQKSAQISSGDNILMMSMNFGGRNYFYMVFHSSPSLRRCCARIGASSRSTSIWVGPDDFDDSSTLNS